MGTVRSIAAGQSKVEGKDAQKIGTVRCERLSALLFLASEGKVAGEGTPVPPYFIPPNAWRSSLGAGKGQSDLLRK